MKKWLRKYSAFTILSEKPFGVLSSILCISMYSSSHGR